MLMLYEVMQKKQQDDLGNYKLKVWGQLPSLLLRVKPGLSENYLKLRNALSGSSPIHITFLLC